MTMAKAFTRGAFLAALTAGLITGAPPAPAVDGPVLWPATALAKVLRSDLPGNGTPTVLRLSAARGETVSGQAVYTPGVPVDAATVSVTDLARRGSGGVIRDSAVKLQWVRYIDVQKNSSRIPPDELDIIAPNPMPDPFWEGDTVPVRVGTFSILDNSIYIAHRSQPVWIEITVPRDAAPGDYEGVLTVTGGPKPVELPVVLHVWDFDIPEEPNTSTVTWWNMNGRGLEPVEAYTDAYWERLSQFARFVAAHRQTDVGIVPIEIIGESEDGSGGYAYDTATLEKYAETVFAEGIRRIHLHTVGRLSEAGGISGVGRGVLDRNRHVEPWEPGMRRLPALEAMTKRRGWVGRFLVNISDEPFMHNEESYAAVVDLVHKTAPTIPVIEACEAEYLGDLDAYCPKINHLDMWFDTYKEHQRNGSELWFYTSRIPVGRYPNRFIDCSLTKMRVQFWMLYRFELDGYLFWALNSPYTDEPYTDDAVGRNSPLGNPLIAYPSEDGRGLVGSLRFSAQRDGLQDYEYLRVLEDRIRAIGERSGNAAPWLDPRQRPVELCNRVTWGLNGYTRDPAVMLDVREAVAREIEALDGEPFLYVQTSPPEGTVVPAGPRNIGIRGIATPGAKVTINGDPVTDIQHGGYFRRYHFMLDGEPVITIEAEYNGKKRTVTRTFILTD